MSRKRFLAIVDPWANPMPSDVEEFPYLESDTSIQCQLIHNQLPRLRPLFDDIIVITSAKKTHPIFDELPKYPSVMHEYISLDKRHDWDMWLCGFHYGKCIHAKIDEVKDEFNWSPNRFNIIRNLSFLFPKDTKEVILKYYSCRQTVLDTKEYNWDFEERLHEV